MDLSITGTTLTIDEDRIAADSRVIKRKLERYLAGERIIFDEPTDFSGFTGFQKRVLGELRTITYGETITYAELAKRIGNPGAVRAVGNACGVNPAPIVVPCHRVVAKNGLGGYAGGVDVKKKLLELEDSHASASPR